MKKCINNKDLELIMKSMIGKELTYDNLLQAIHDFGYLTIKEENLGILFGYGDRIADFFWSKVSVVNCTCYVNLEKGTYKVLGLCNVSNYRADCN